MSLPKINNNPKYTISIPSTQKQVKFRPFLVKEEKVLMIAFESKDPQQMLTALGDTVISCIADKIDPHTLTTFDIEYLFIKIRSKSVGESVDLNLKCNQCDIDNKVKVDLNSIEILVPKVATNISLGEGIELKMKYPRYFDVVSLQQDGNVTADDSFKLVAQCIDSVITTDDIIKISDEPIDEVLAFIDQLDTTQFKKVQQFVQSIPALTHDIEFKCSCGCDNKVTLKGLQDFF